MRRVAAFLVLVLLLVRAPGADAARPVLDGWPGPRAEAEALVQPALRSPRDSLALAVAIERLTRRLQDGGWLAARARGAWSASAAPELSVDVSAGPRYRWGPIVIDAPAADSAAFASALDCAQGSPASPRAMAAGIRRAVDEAEAAGYAWATLGVSGWTTDSGRVSVRLTGTRGPRVSVDALRIAGLQVTRTDVAERALGRLRGRPYDPAAAFEGTRRLEQLGIFRRVEYLGLLGAADWAHGVLSWRVVEPRYNTFEGAVGVQGAKGAVGLARLELGNLLGTARSVAVSWQSRGHGLTDFGARFVEPMVFGRAVRWEGAMQQQIQDTLFTRFRYGMRARVALDARDRLEAGIEAERVVQPHGDVRDADARNTTFAIAHDGRDDATRPRRGVRARIETTQRFVRQTLRPVSGEPAVRRNAGGGAMAFEADVHVAMGRSAGLALEARSFAHLGGRRTYDDWERYPVGGAASLRGHDEDAFRVDRYVLTRLEWRWFLGAEGQRVALFWDHAQMETRRPLAAGGAVLERRSAEGLGAGLRLPAAGGDVDFDYGLEPGRGFLEGKVHLRLVTAF